MRAGVRPHRRRSARRRSSPRTPRRSRPGQRARPGLRAGATAVWLARRGLSVRGLDVSPVALERAATWPRAPVSRSAAISRSSTSTTACRRGRPADVIVSPLPGPSAGPGHHRPPGTGRAAGHQRAQRGGRRPGPFRAEPGELRAAFADLTVIAAGGDGESLAAGPPGAAGRPSS